MSQTPNLPPALFTTFPWNQEPVAIWVASSFILRRNLARYNFPSKLQPQEVEQVLQNLTSALTSLEGFQNPQAFPQNALSASDRELLYEHFLFLRGFQEPPNGSGMVLDEKGELLALINTSNHLELRALNVNTPPEETWNHLAQVEDALSKSHPFAFSPKFGYLTVDPGQCGTGLTVNAYLHLPALIHTGQIESAINNAAEDEVLFMGLSGDLMDLVGDIIIVQNTYTIGMSEEQILNAIQQAVGKLVSAERTMRKHLQEEKNTDLMDLTSKAFGLLVHSFQLETKEALDLLSVMKLGASLGLITNVEDRKLNELFFKCRRGHLTQLFPELKENEEIAKKRADFLQKELSGIALSSELQ